MEYCPDERSMRLLGPNGSFSFKRTFGLETPFTEFPLLPLSSIREFRIRRTQEPNHLLDPIEFPPLSFPALETLTIEYEVTASNMLSAFFSDPSSSPSLKTLAFLDCFLDEGFMEALTRFASNRKNTTSARLHRVVIVNSKGNVPSLASIDALRTHVPVVDVRIGKELPVNLT
jgi:hypothetical protein